MQNLLILNSRGLVTMPLQFLHYKNITIETYKKYILLLWAKIFLYECKSRLIQVINVRFMTALSIILFTKGEHPTGTETKSYPPSAFVVFFFFGNTTIPTFLGVVSNCFLTTFAQLDKELDRYKRSYGQAKPKIPIIWPFAEKIWWPLLFTIIS